jgi:5'-3' exonuclease, N-terminal resolvase-like domain/T4 RNase H, C terminal
VILIDFSQVAISNLHQLLKQGNKDRPKHFNPDTGEEEFEDPNEVNANLLRHMILNSIRRINKMFRSKYGNLVLCTDNINYWRKDVFPYYKANRKKDRKEADIDWDAVFVILDQLREEIRENFPYKVINIHNAEADDVIGTITKHYHDQEPILIVSGDKDFQQLQIYPNVKQYGPIQDKFLTPEDPKKFLFEHICNGDKGDGVPNFLSADDCLVNGVRQTSVYQAKVDVWYTQTPEEFCNEQTLKNFYRNKKLVDLSQIPPEVEAAILDEFAIPAVGARDMIYGYLVRMRMRNLLESVREF